MYWIVTIEFEKLYSVEIRGKLNYPEIRELFKIVIVHLLFHYVSAFHK